MFHKLLLVAALAAVVACESAAPPAPPSSTATESAEGVRRYDIQVAVKPLVRADTPQDPYRGDYDFDEERDWFSPNIPVWDRAFEELKGRPGLRYLEIGCFEGRSAVWMLENVLTDPSSKMTCLDPYQDHIGETVKQRFLANVAAAGAADRVELIQGYSQEELRGLPLDAYDVIYIDGDHRAGPVLEDAVLSWRLLKVGGLMIFDDYAWEITRPLADRPLAAADFFTEAFRDKIEVVHRDYQLILRKTGRH